MRPSYNSDSEGQIASRTHPRTLQYLSDRRRAWKTLAIIPIVVTSVLKVSRFAIDLVTLTQDEEMQRNYFHLISANTNEKASFATDRTRLSQGRLFAQPPTPSPPDAAWVSPHATAKKFGRKNFVNAAGSRFDICFFCNLPANLRCSQTRPRSTTLSFQRLTLSSVGTFRRRRIPVTRVLGRSHSIPCWTMSYIGQSRLPWDPNTIHWCQPPRAGQLTRDMLVSDPLLKPGDFQVGCQHHIRRTSLKSHVTRRSRQQLLSIARMPSFPRSVFRRRSLVVRTSSCSLVGFSVTTVETSGCIC